jgi:DNA-binding beta-propeller fold protein YncE
LDTRLRLKLKRIAVNVARSLTWIGLVLALLIGSALALNVGDIRSNWRLLAFARALMRPTLTPSYLGDGRSADQLLLCGPMGLALNKAGELLVSDRGRDWRGRVVWRIDMNGIAHIFAGTGSSGTATEDRALDLNLERPEGLAVAPNGDVFLSDGFNHVVLRIDSTGRVSRFAGTGSPGYSGDGGPAEEAQLFRPADVRLDSLGNLYIADVRNQRIRTVDPGGTITTIAGTGETGFSPDGSLATEARLDTPWGITVDRENRLLIADSANQRVRRVEHDGRLVTVAGSGRRGFDGDGGLATDAAMNFPEALFVDEEGALFIGDEFNHAIRVVNRDGIISTIMGTGFAGRAEIGALARGSPLADPENIVATGHGIFVTDDDNGRVIVIANGRVESAVGRGDIEACSTPRL